MTDAQTAVIPISEHESLEGNLTLPADAWGAVLFAHGSGSSRHSPRNRYVAEVLQRLGLATLLVDLLKARRRDIARPISPPH
jgi:putative phosphoribosyl transferase